MSSDWRHDPGGEGMMGEMMGEVQARANDALERHEEAEADQPSPLQRGWVAMIAEVRASASPQRFTFEGQTMPWMDPIPSPDDDPDAPYDGPMGLCPHAMLRRVRTMRKVRGRALALVLLAQTAGRIATLRRDDWNRRLEAEKAAFEEG